MRFAALVFSLFAFSAVADEAAKPVVKWTLLDQHEQAYTLSDDAQVLLIARSMAAAKLLDAALKDQPAGYLEARHVVYVADIEKMPSLVKLPSVNRSLSLMVTVPRSAPVVLPALTPRPKTDEKSTLL